MTEISKMFENAGIEKKRMCEWTCKGSEFCSTNCEHYESTKEFYPPFTAERQIELIKKIGNINIDIDNGCYMSSEILKVEAHCDEFEETLAEFVNNLWQSLTDQEKEEIRNILDA